MMRRLLLLCLIVCAQSMSAAIQVERMTTYDTGARMLNGRWRIGSEVRMSFIGNDGAPVPVNWRTQHWINSDAGALLVGTGWQQFNSGRFWSLVDAYGDFATCYRGKAIAIVGSETKEVGGNQVCTAPPPPPPDWCQTHPTAIECGFDWTCPILINMENGPWSLVGAAERVHFDMDADGEAEPLSWTSGSSALAFLVLDRDGNGTIDNGTELFGNATPTAGGRAANGFVALLEYDANGDGVIDRADAIWNSLQLWTDRNHDAVSQPTELQPLTGSPLVALSLRYHWTAREDQHGNAFRYEAVATFARGARPYYDVYFIRFR